MVKRIGYLSRGPEFDSQDLHGCYELTICDSSSNTCFWLLQAIRAYGTQTYANKTHIKKKNKEICKEEEFQASDLRKRGTTGDT